ncbi:MAG: hypothetical protein JKY65_26655 [Planctomycetes bacterium]|nr:hypothetical protein [Planctomycetota bacterium]
MSEHDTPYPEPEIEPSPEELEALEAAFDSEFGTALSRAHDDAIEVMEPARLDVLARVREKLEDEASSNRRRIRRRHLRVLFYVVNLVAVVLICVIYVMTHAAIRLKETEGHILATQTEVVSLTRALVRHLAEDKQAPLPHDIPALIKALSATPEHPARYPLDPDRLRAGTYVDDFGRPYVIRVDRERVLIYSIGPNKIDDHGQRDDITDQWVTFVR